MGKEEKNENIYVFERSIEIDQDRLDSVRRGIENERQKAGVLIGFIALALIEGYSKLEHLCFIPRIFIVGSFLVAGGIALSSFRSYKMKNSLLTEKCFNLHWTSKEKFLRFQHKAITDVVEYQKNRLSEISQRMFLSVCFVGIAMFLIGLSIIF